MKRNYKQLCPIAYTLDIIGERWTLLIIRELFYGERRFSDLLRALHGIGANLLSSRLKELEQKKLVTRRDLPPPAATHVYGLTERGKGLKSILRELALWGLPYIKFPFEEDFNLSVVSVMSALEGIFFNANAAKDVTLICEIHTEGGSVSYCYREWGVTNSFWFCSRSKSGNRGGASVFARVVCQNYRT